MSLIGLVVVLIVIGVCLYLISLIPMDAKIQRIIQVVVILIVILWLLSIFLPTGTFHVPIRR